VEIILVRHAEPARPEDPALRADPGLSDDGRRQAEAVADRLGNEAWDALYTSPQRRSRETAAVISRAGFASLLAGIAEVEGPQAFHCSEGKDRTGWAAMLLQSLVGVSRDDVVTDFLVTNQVMQLTGPTLEVAREFFGDRPDEFFLPAMVADVAYLEAGLEQLEADFGDVETYLRGGLGLDDDQLHRLRGHLLG